MSTVKSVTASQLSMTLTVTLVVLLAILVGGSALAATSLLGKSTEASHAQIDAAVSSSDVSRLSDTQSYLAKQADTIAGIDALAQTDRYDQNKIIATINSYASKAGITIASIDFNEAAPGTAATPSATTSPTAQLAFSAPLDYQRFLAFLKLVEQGTMPAKVVSAQINNNTSIPNTVGIFGLGIKVIQ